MKKLALAFCLLAVSFTAQAQFEKGILSGSKTHFSRNDIDFRHVRLFTNLEAGT